VWIYLIVENSGKSKVKEGNKKVNGCIYYPLKRIKNNVGVLLINSKNRIFLEKVSKPIGQNTQKV
jgi:hypothetical protein